MKPDEKTLRDLYENQHLSTREIGKIFDVAHISVRRWMEKYSIVPRPKVPYNSLIARGITPPTREELIHMIHEEHLGYMGVAAKYGVDFTAIAYWLKKYDIPRPKIWSTRRKGKEPIIPDEKTIRSLYSSGLTLSQIASRYGFSRTLLVSLCDKYGIDKRTSGFNGGVRFSCQDGGLVRSTYEQRAANWLYSHEIPYSYEPKLPFDRRLNADFLANGWYIEIWGVDRSSRYEERKKRKLLGYRSHGLPLIQISPHHFSDSGRILEKKLSKCLSPAITQLPLVFD